MNTDYKQLYQEKCDEFKELNAQFAEYQQQSNYIISDLQQEIRQFKKRTEAQNKELTQIKEKRKNFNNNYEKQIEQTKKEREQFKNKFMQFEKKVIELENINQSLESDLRATKATLSQYEQRIQKTMEQLALLQVQMQESTQNNQQQIARLRSQLKETQDQLYALHHTKHLKIQERAIEQQQKQNQIHNLNQNQSFHSKFSVEKKKSQIGESKIKRKNTKFTQTLTELRTFIQQISAKSEQISKKF